MRLISVNLYGIAFSSAPGANYAKPSALQKSKTAIGFGLGNQPKQEKRTDNNTSRAAEVRPHCVVKNWLLPHVLMFIC